MTTQHTALGERATALRGLHAGPRPLVLPNAWHVASARLVVKAGFPVVATSSGAVGASLGYEDTDSMPTDEAFGVVARIARSVPVPVTADLEAGYGLSPAELVRRLFDAGAVGCNLEDTDHHGGGGLVDAARRPNGCVPSAARPTRPDPGRPERADRCPAPGGGPAGALRGSRATGASLSPSRGRLCVPHPPRGRRPDRGARPACGRPGQRGGGGRTTARSTGAVGSGEDQLCGFPHAPARRSGGGETDRDRGRTRPDRTPRGWTLSLAQPPPYCSNSSEPISARRL